MQQTLDTTSWTVNEPEVMDMDRFLSGANAPEIIEDVRLCIDSGSRRMILNCASLTYLTAAGLRAITEIARMMRQAEGRVAVKGLSGQPRDIFYACGINDFIPSMDEIPALSVVGAP